MANFWGALVPPKQPDVSVLVDDSIALSTLIKLFSFLGFRGVRFSVHDKPLFIHALCYICQQFLLIGHIFFLSIFRSIGCCCCETYFSDVPMCICLEQHVFQLKAKLYWTVKPSIQSNKYYEGLSYAHIILLLKKGTITLFKRVKNKFKVCSQLLSVVKC